MTTIAAPARLISPALLGDDAWLELGAAFKEDAEDVPVNDWEDASDGAEELDVEGSPTDDGGI